MPPRGHHLYVFADLRIARRDGSRPKEDAGHGPWNQIPLSGNGIPQQYLHAVSGRSELQTRSRDGAARARFSGIMGGVLSEVPAVALDRQPDAPAYSTHARIHP